VRQSRRLTTVARQDVREGKPVKETPAPLRQARERLGGGLRTIEADTIPQSDEISLRRGVTPTAGAQTAA
jgi:hypothetical protein